MIYEVRLRNISISKAFRDAESIDNFITYVIAGNDVVAMKLAIEIAEELGAKEIRSVVAKPKLSLSMLYEAIEISSPRLGPKAVEAILKFSKQAFKGFKGYK